MPYLKFTLQTSLSAELAASRLVLITRASDGFFDFMGYSFGPSKNKNMKFIGDATPEHFKIRRVIKYNNLFLPIIHGQFHPTIRGAEISILMFLRPTSIFFIVLIFALFSFGIWRSISHSMVTDLLFAIGVIVSGLGLTTAGFFPEAFIAKRILIETFEAKED